MRVDLEGIECIQGSMAVDIVDLRFFPIGWSAEEK